jgi:hypothetical protein
MLTRKTKRCCCLCVTALWPMSCPTKAICCQKRARKAAPAKCAPKEVHATCNDTIDARVNVAKSKRTDFFFKAEHDKHVRKKGCLSVGVFMLCECLNEPCSTRRRTTATPTTCKGDGRMTVSSRTFPLTATWNLKKKKGHVTSTASELKKGSTCCRNSR